jgi:hypothetical protein
MKKVFFAAICFALFNVSCSNDNPVGDNNVQISYRYMTLTQGSNWIYETTDNTTATSTQYSLTSTNVDTIIGTRTYHIFENTDTSGTNPAYYNISGKNYFQFTQLDPQLPVTELNYLISDTAVGTNWTTPISSAQAGGTLFANVKNTIESNNAQLNVNGVNYSNLIKVKTEIIDATITISVQGFPIVLTPTIVQNLYAYYAPNYGMVERGTLLQITVQGQPSIININSTTKLFSSNIQ